MSTKNISEEIVKRVLEVVLPGAVLIYRTSQSNGEYDFDLRCRNGDVAALEVTASLDESWMRTHAAIHGKRDGGSVVNAQECKKTWILFPAKATNISKLRRQADHLLAEFERKGIKEIDCLRSYHDSAIQNVCNEIQITEAKVIAEAGATILIGPLVGSGVVGSNSAVQAAEEEATKLDNIKKLGAAGTKERHLAVYIDARSVVPWTSLTEFEPPRVKPNLPPEITDLWIIGHTHNANEFIAWHGSMNKEFSAMNVSCDISDLIGQRTR